MEKEKKINLDNFIECEECGILVNKNNAQKIIVSDCFEDRYRKHYCQSCKKPYDKERLCDGIEFYKIISSQSIRVTARGKSFKKKLRN